MVHREGLCLALVGLPEHVAHFEASVFDSTRHAEVEARLRECDEEAGRLQNAIDLVRNVPREVLEFLTLLGSNFMPTGRLPTAPALAVFRSRRALSSPRPQGNSTIGPPLRGAGRLQIRDISDFRGLGAPRPS
jgi:hypothetical protein